VLKAWCLSELLLGGGGTFKRWTPMGGLSHCHVPSEGLLDPASSSLSRVLTHIALPQAREQGQHGPKPPNSCGQGNLSSSNLAPRVFMQQWKVNTTVNSTSLKVVPILLSTEHTHTHTHTHSLTWQ
jgi:hypothetical protein